MIHTALPVKQHRWGPASWTQFKFVTRDRSIKVIELGKPLPAGTILHLYLTDASHSFLSHLWGSISSFIKTNHLWGENISQKYFAKIFHKKSNRHGRRNVTEVELIHLNGNCQADRRCVGRLVDHGWHRISGARHSGARLADHGWHRTRWRSTCCSVVTARNPPPVSGTSLAFKRTNVQMCMTRVERSMWLINHQLIGSEESAYPALANTLTNP